MTEEANETEDTRNNRREPSTRDVERLDRGYDD